MALEFAQNPAPAGGSLFHPTAHLCRAFGFQHRDAGENRIGQLYASVQGVLVKIAAGTNMPALTGINISAGNYNVVCFYVNSAGTVQALAGTQGSSLGGVVFPAPPQGQALVGFLIITYASAFTGGTTALSTATTVYVSPLGPFDPTVLIGGT